MLFIVLDSCLWDSWRQLLQVPSPLGPLCKIVDLGGEFSTSSMEEQLNHRSIEWLRLEKTLKIT